MRSTCSASRSSRGVLLALLLCGLLGADCSEPESVSSAPALAPAAAPVSVRGVLRVAAYAAGGGAAADPVVHRSVFVNGTSYRGMEDNDLRGFLDGRFRYGWNQPGQFHVRAGRFKGGARWGETELFRTLYRWGDLDLPRDLRVESARVRLFVEAAPESVDEVTALLYAVQPDFDPGEGGERGDNFSPPRPGEVWWGEVAHDAQPWGKPGASHASDVDPAADTPAQALAEATVGQGRGELVFASEALARYVQDQIRAGDSVRLLLKLSDRDEDVEGTLIKLWSGNEGVDRDPVRRPRLEVDWWSPSQVAGLEHRIHLEHGRRAAIPAVAAPPGVRWVVSYEADVDSERPVIKGEGPELEVLSARDPVSLGERFATSFRDTWSTSAPPEEQEVQFTFIAPSGRVHRLPAVYEGDFTWSVDLLPEELGRWRYFYEHRLDEGFRSADGHFDVLPGGAEAVGEQLSRLAREVGDRYGEETTRQTVSDFGPRFWQLQRAALASLSPAQWESESGRELDARIVEVRRAMDRKKPLRKHLRLRPGKWRYEIYAADAKGKSQ